MPILNLLILTTLATIIPGQLIRIPFSSGALNITDLFVFATLGFFYFHSMFIKKRIVVPKNIFFTFVLFILWASASTILSLNVFSFTNVLVSSLFLLRFAAYFSFALVVFNVIKKGKIQNWVNVLILLGLIFCSLGFVQLIFFSDLSTLQAYGWDPHKMRLVSTFLDPNFTGGFLSVFAALALSFYLYKNNKRYLAALAIFIIAIVFTFSRSSYLAIVVVMVVIGTVKAPKVLLITAVVSLASFFFIPQVKTRIIGAFTIDETAAARLLSWQKALTVFVKNPIFGVGFNTYRYAQENYGFFSFDNPTGGHSGAGSDSSILLVAATTGAIGLVFYLTFLGSIAAVFIKKIKDSPLYLASFSSMAALLIHSQFVNSLFYPQIMLVIWFMLGLTLVNDN